MDARGFPSLLLPWWLGKTLEKKPDLRFHSDLVYSTVNGYYYVRLVDNVMDGHAADERELLPAAAFFHSRFQGVYQVYFAPDHAFWKFFTSAWLRSNESVIREVHFDRMDRETFGAVAAKKVCAAQIPLAAVCYRSERPDRLCPWVEFCDLLAHVMQMMDDVFDWHGDASRNITTYFLSQASERKRPEESVAAWVIREGFDWGLATVDGWLSELVGRSRDLGSSELRRYLVKRRTLLREDRRALLEGRRALRRSLAAILKVQHAPEVESIGGKPVPHR